MGKIKKKGGKMIDKLCNIFPFGIVLLIILLVSGVFDDPRYKQISKATTVQEVNELHDAFVSSEENAGKLAELIRYCQHRINEIVYDKIKKNYYNSRS